MNNDAEEDSVNLPDQRALEEQNSVQLSVQNEYVVTCNVKSIRISGIFSPSHVICSSSNSTEATQTFVHKMVNVIKIMNQSQQSLAGSQFNDSFLGSSIKNEGSTKFDAAASTTNDIIDSVAKPSDVMRSRWLASATQLPSADQDDIQNHNPHFNGGVNVSDINQHFPEYSQSSYLRMRSQEEAYALFNYLDPQLNPRLQKFQADQSSGGLSASSTIFSKRDRSYGIQRIFFLAREKDYKNDTIFMAANIFDRYLQHVGHWSFPVK